MSSATLRAPIIHDDSESDQVPRRRLESVTHSLILEKAVGTEHDSNWFGAQEPVPVADVPKEVNTVTSYFVFRVKNDEICEMKLKSRLCPHGN